MSGAGHNSVAGGQLLQLVEAIERIDEEIRDLNADKSERYKLAKGEGFDVKTLKRLIQRRRMGRQERAEQDELLDLYEHAIEQASAPRVRTREEARAEMHRTASREAAPVPVSDPAEDELGFLGSREG